MRASLLAAAVLLLAQQAAAQGTNYCDGSVQLTATSGSFTDHDGLGHYRDNSFCAWEIRPQGALGTQIRLDFSDFELEYWYDFVVVYDNVTTNAPVLALLTGDSVPEPVFSSGMGMLVVFRSDQIVSRSGFSASYRVVNCPGGCSGQGQCTEAGCVCDAGFTGTNCEQGTCTTSADCGGNGQCVVGTSGRLACQCDEGFYGGDCLNPYCEPQHVMVADNGTLTDHHGPGEYLNNQRCSWLIDPNDPGSGVALTFTRFNLELGWDYLTIYDGFHPSNSSLLGVFSGDSLPPTVHSHSGAMLIEFASDQGITAPGFEANYQVLRCPNDCGPGWCTGNNVCHCPSGYTGTACEVQSCAGTNGCNGHGTCPQGATVCTCNAGWTGNDCGTCVGATCISSQHCSGATATNTSTGPVIQDHIGQGSYTRNSACSWHIDATPVPPPASADDLTVATLDFNRLALVPQEAFVSVWDGNHAIGVFSDVYAPASLPRLLARGTDLSVYFTSSNSTQVESGMKATFGSVTCAGGCGTVEHAGTCTLAGTCQCSSGFTGPNCEQTECVTDSVGDLCGASANRGSCATVASGSACVCQPGWFGVDCSATHCSGEQTLTGSSGEFSDHSVGSAYQPNSRCVWNVAPASFAAGDSISVFLPEFQMARGDELVVTDTATQEVLATLVGDEPIAPMRFPRGRLTFTFTSDARVNRAGFDLMYTVSSECPEGCNNHGHCLRDGTRAARCYCDSFYSGASCLTLATITPLVADRTVTQALPAWEWRHFSFTVNETQALAAELNFAVSRVTNNGHPEFYLSTQSVATRTEYDSRLLYYQTALSSLRVRSPAAGTTYFVSIFDADAPRAQTVDVSVTATLSCPESCGEGYCNNTSNRCVCDECVTGLTCEDSIPDCQTGAPGSIGFVIAALVLLVIAGVATVAIIIVYRKKMKQGLADARARRQQLAGEADDDDDDDEAASLEGDDASTASSDSSATPVTDSSDQ